MHTQTNQSAVVIGGTHGMGFAIARAILERGGQVLVTGRNPQNVDAARAELGPRATLVQSDASDLDAIQALARSVRERLGTVDAVFINVGISELEPFAEVTPASYERQFAVNTRGAFFSAQQLAPLVRDGGALVFTTVTPATGTPTMSVYMATKGAVRGFARVLAAELLPRRIRVNMVAPGFIATPTLGVAGASPEERAELARVGDEITPMKRHGTAEEVARAALFLAFDATFTTGVELPVDGGLSEVDAPAPGA